MAEGGIRVPLIIGGKGIEGGQKSDAFAYVWDIMPTLLDMANIGHPETYGGKQVERMKGRSLVPLMSGKTDRIYGEEDYVVGELTDGKWIRQGDYKAL